jgi:FdhD protein
MTRPQAPPVGIRRFQDGAWREADDQLAGEEPLQLSLGGDALSVVMRTPGNDLELALGLLFAERVIRALDDVVRIRISAEAQEAEPAVRVEADLIEANAVDVYVTGPGRRPERTFLQSSACGVCGATTVEALVLDFPPPEPGPMLDPQLLAMLPDRLREAQELFARTGGLHAAGVFDKDGGLVTLREDVGRHNAVDKVVGRLLLEGRLPATGYVLVVSGRAGYELVQKALAAGFPTMAAVGAPSSLAVATARRFGMTLLGFVRASRMNVYSGVERVRGAG